MQGGRGAGRRLQAAEVRAAEALWVSHGINSVPAVVAEGKYLISGGQPAGVFEEALRGWRARDRFPSTFYRSVTLSMTTSAV